MKIAPTQDLFLSPNPSNNLVSEDSTTTTYMPSERYMWKIGDCGWLFFAAS